jgi:hypothetical protein
VQISHVTVASLPCVILSDVYTLRPCLVLQEEQTQAIDPKERVVEERSGERDVADTTR